MLGKTALLTLAVFAAGGAGLYLVVERAIDSVTSADTSGLGALLAALGRLYGRSHRLLAAEAVPLDSMGDVCAHLLSPFPHLDASLQRLVDEHGLRDVETPTLKAALALLDEAPQAIPEGVPPPDFEPEPEPEPA